MTTTRYCLSAKCGHGTGLLRAIPLCDRECGKYIFTLKHKNMPAVLILKGNTQFFKNGRLPENPKEFNIDRLVYEPEIPI
jgi:hypothetical protein